jgi:GNAT superfamily N-acetyltransferase
MAELSDGMVSYLTRVDGDHHVAIVAGVDSHDLKDELGVGVARFVRLADRPDVAEAAVTVVDDMQGKGVGRLLLQALAREARARGVQRFRGMVLADNARMRHLLAEVGARVYPEDAETLAFEVPVEGAPEAEPQAEHPLRRLLRAAAASLGVLAPSWPRAPAGEDGRVV